MAIRTTKPFRPPGLLVAAGKYYGPQVQVSGAVGVVNQLLLVPVLLAVDGRIDQFTLRTHTVAGDATYLARIGLLHDNAGLPGKVVAEVNVPCGWATNTLLLIAADIRYRAGHYWVGVVRNGTGTAGTLTGGPLDAGDVDNTFGNEVANSPTSRVLRSDGVTGAIPDDPPISWQELNFVNLFMRRATS